MIYACTCPYIHKRCVHRRQRCCRANSLNKASGGGGLLEKGYTKLCNYHARTARQRNPSGHCLLMCSYISSACQSVQSANMSSLYNGLAGNGISRCGSPISRPTARSAYRCGRRKKAKQENGHNVRWTGCANPRLIFPFNTSYSHADYYSLLADERTPISYLCSKHKAKNSRLLPQFGMKTRESALSNAIHSLSLTYLWHRLSFSFVFFVFLWLWVWSLAWSKSTAAQFFSSRGAAETKVCRKWVKKNQKNWS